VVKVMMRRPTQRAALDTTTPSMTTSLCETSCASVIDTTVVAEAEVADADAHRSARHAIRRMPAL
jgi:hypothetical protein